MLCQRVTFVAKEKVEVQPLELPEPGPGQVLLQAEVSVISPGTELAHLHWLPGAQWPMPSGAGYCLCGTVVARGPGVENLAVGQRVVAGVTHASAAVADVAACYAVPPGLPPEEAAAFTLVAIALQAVRKAEVRLGLSVAVLGLGVIGNLAGQLARAAGATLVVGIDPVAFRRDVALSCGFDYAYESGQAMSSASLPQLARSGGGFDVVIEATGRPEPIVSAFRLARRMGRVVLLATTRGNTAEVNFADDVHRKGLTVVGAHNGIRPAADDIGSLFTFASDVRVALELLAGGRIKIGPLLSAVLPWQQAPEAYARLADRQQPVMTFALNWRQASA